MNRLKNIFFNKNRLNQFRIEVLTNMKWFSIIAIFCLILIKFINSNHRNYGIAVKKNIWHFMVNEKDLPDSIYYVAKGIAPIPKNNFFIKLLLGTGQEMSNGFAICNFDFILIVILLIFAHFFAKDILRYGPFQKNAMKWLSRSVKLCIIGFICKGIINLIIIWIFDKNYDAEFSVDNNFYMGSNGWLYFAVLLGFFLNVFNYGRKLQAENDLTI